MTPKTTIKDRTGSGRRPFTVRLTPTIRRELARIAKAKDIPESQVLRDILKDFLAKYRAAGEIRQV